MDLTPVLDFHYDNLTPPVTGNVLSGDLDEARMLVETADRGKRHIEGEVSEARDHMSTLANANNALSVDKRRLEADLRGAQQELDNLVNQVRYATQQIKEHVKGGR